MKYIVFIRLLCQDKITKEEINDAKLIIDDFIIEYEKLYGLDSMTFNLHAHLHLPIQTLRYGPLNKSACFCFENMFKISRDLYHGTRNYEGQIAHNLELRKINKTNLDELESNTDNSAAKHFINTFFSKKQFLKEDFIVNPKKISINSLKNYEKELLKEVNASSDEEIYVGKKAIINSKGSI